MSGKGFTAAELVDTGLLVRRDDGNMFDRFRNRLMIPIHDWKGRPTGFGARALKDGDEPKYLNSPQTELFDKSKTLYGLHFAKNAIRESGQAAIVEGYMDAIAAHQAGFTNVVASLGTALTEMQFRQLQKLARRFILALDADSAGVNAMQRGYFVPERDEMKPRFDPRGLVRFEGKLRVDIRVLVLPEGKDPDDVIRREPKRWVELTDQAKPVAEFVIDALLVGRDLGNPKDKAALTDEIVPFIRDIADPVERSAYAQQLARRLKVDERAVIRQVETAAAPAKPVRASRAGEGPAPKREADRERYCLIGLLRVPYALRAIDDALARADLPPFDAEDFESVTHREVFLAIHSALEETVSPSIDDVLDRLDPALHADVPAWLESSPPPPQWGPDVDETRGVVDAALLLRERNLRTQGAQIEDLIRSASEQGDAESVRELGQAKLALSGQMRRLSRIRYAPEFIRQSYADNGR